MVIRDLSQCRFSGMVFMAASWTFHDWEFLQALQDHVWDMGGVSLAATWPVEILRQQPGGDAALLDASVLGPLWERTTSDEDCFQVLAASLEGRCTPQPKAFLLRALVIAVLDGSSNLIGLREYTSFLSGTSANLNMSWQTAATLGLIHLLLYVAFILFVPTSLIAAGLLALWNRWKRREKSGGSKQSPRKKFWQNRKLRSS